MVGVGAEHTGCPLWLRVSPDPRAPPVQGRPRTLPGADPGLGASFKMQMALRCLAATAVTGCEFVPTNSILQYF